MKTIPFILLSFGLTCTGLVAQKRTFPALQKQTQILFDFRVERTSAAPKIPSGTERTVLSKVFRKYLTDASKCNPDFDASGNDPLEAARNAGQIVPSIDDVASGSFTAPGRPETAYVIFVSECNAAHADNYGTKRVAIFSGQQLIADVDVNFKRSIVRKTDLNSDGLDELLMVGGDMNQGSVFEAAALLDFPNGRVRVIEDFGTVKEDSCASGLPDSSLKASIVSRYSYWKVWRR